MSQLSNHSAVTDAFAAIEFTPDGTILGVNERFLKLMGYSEQELVGQHHRMLCDRETIHDPEYQQLWLRLAHGHREYGEVRRITKSGQAIWLSATYCPIKTAEGEVSSVIKMATDISQTVNELQKLRSESQAMSRAMAMVEMSLEGEILAANQNFLNLMGYTEAELIGEHHQLLCREDYKSSDDYQEFWQVLRTGRFHRGRVERINKSGQLIQLEANYNPIFDRRGHLQKVLKLAYQVA